MALIPCGRTLENINGSQIIEKEEKRVDQVADVCKILDRFHFAFIEKALRKIRFDDDLLCSYFLLEAGDTKNLKTVKGSLYSVIDDVFRSFPEFSYLTKKELFTKILPSFTTDEKERAMIEQSSNYTGYFAEHIHVRLNLYNTKGKAGGIATRIIEDNLPVFMDNIHKLEVIEKKTGMLSLWLDDIFHHPAVNVPVSSLRDMFQPEAFNQVLSQQQIDAYNLIVCGDDGKSPDGPLRGLNVYINQYNQQCSADDRLPMFGRLYKMILSEDGNCRTADKFTDDNQLITSIADCYRAVSSVLADDGNNISVEKLLQNMFQYDISHIHVKQKDINNLSLQIYSKWDVIQQALVGQAAYKAFKARKSFSVAEIHKALGMYNEEMADAFKRWFDGWHRFNEHSCIAKVIHSGRKAEYLFQCSYPKNKTLTKQNEDIRRIKNLLDDMVSLKRTLALFDGEVGETGRDDSFYRNYRMIMDVLSVVTPLYNRVRNYLTSKPYSVSKIRLNMGYIDFLAGWNTKKVNAYGAVLLRRQKDIYLAVINPDRKKQFNVDKFTAGEENYELIQYRQVSGLNKMLPKIFFSKNWLERNLCNPTDEMLESYRKGRHVKGDSFDLTFCRQLIDHFKKCISLYPEWEVFSFDFSDTDTYEDIGKFYNEVEAQAYRIWFQNIDCSIIDRLVDEGSVYLFRLYNRDLSPFSKGRKQLQTLYYQMLFDERNLNDLVVRLNGGAEMFWRKKSIHINRPTHPAGVPVENKNPLNSKRQSIFAYDLVKDRRYTGDTFELHFMVTLNAGRTKFFNMNAHANDYIRKNRDRLHVIGINRGERNLVYITVIDPDGNIVEQCSLNCIDSGQGGSTYTTDYHELLSRREAQRQEARQSWKTVQDIAQLKDGYISMVLHKICRLVDKYNAVVAIENIDTAFKKSRRKIEKAVYEKFETMLVNKLNYMVDKGKDPLENGGVLRGVQLTGNEAGMHAVLPQNGMLFRVPAWYVSMTCPVTGFVNFLNVQYTSIKEARSFFGKFEDISYNPSAGWYEFKLDYAEFTEKAKGTRTCWTLCTYGQRTDKDGCTDITAEMTWLLDRFGINPGGSLKKDILRQDSKEFFERLTGLVRLTLQMKNVGRNGEDFLVSPVKGRDGKVWSSLEADTTLPLCGDANDAYNIARKAALMLDRIYLSRQDKVSLSIGLTDWLQYAQKFKG